MKLFNFLKTKVKKNNFVAIDIGDSSVKGAIFSLGRKKVEIKKCSIAEIEKFGVFSSANFFKDLILNPTCNLLKSFLKDLKKDKSPSSLLVSFSPKILKAQVIEISYKRNFPESKITQPEEDFIKRVVIHKAQERAKEESFNFQVLKEEILEKKIDGYQVKSILNCQGKNLSFKILTILLKEGSFKITDELKKIFPFENVEILHPAEGIAKLAVFKRLNEKILLDIGEEFTQIFSITGGLDWIEEIEGGGGIFTKCLCRSLNLTEKDAEQLKIKFSKSKLSKPVKERIRKIFLPNAIFWKKLIEEIIQKKSETQFVIPQNCYIIGGGGKFSFLKEVLRKENSNNLGDSFSLKVLPLKDLFLKIGYDCEDKGCEKEEFLPLFFVIFAHLCEKKF